MCVCDANNMRLGGPASVVEQRERERERETRTADSEERLRKTIFEAEGHKRVRPVCSCDTTARCSSVARTRAGPAPAHGSSTGSARPQQYTRYATHSYILLDENVAALFSKQSL